MYDTIYDIYKFFKMSGFRKCHRWDKVGSSCSAAAPGAGLRSNPVPPGAGLRSSPDLSTYYSNYSPLTGLLVVVPVD